jgi:hypothetical protein
MPDTSRTAEPPVTDGRVLHLRRQNRDRRRAEGETRRSEIPLQAHAAVPPAEERADPLVLLRGHESPREAARIPLRYAQGTDPFAFLRGSAAVIASDLSKGPNSGIERAALLRRPPGELRHVRQRGELPGHRPQRLRRNSPPAPSPVM